MLKGLTAQYLLRQTYRVKKGDVILVHAAAGGVGQILCQLLAEDADGQPRPDVLRVPEPCRL